MVLVIAFTLGIQVTQCGPGRSYKKSDFIENNYGFSVDVSNFEKGLYFISIKSEEKIERLKFLVK